MCGRRRQRKRPLIFIILTKTCSGWGHNSYLHEEKFPGLFARRDPTENGRSFRPCIKPRTDRRINNNLSCSGLPFLLPTQKPKSMKRHHGITSEDLIYHLEARWRRIVRDEWGHNSKSARFFRGREKFFSRDFSRRRSFWPSSPPPSTQPKRAKAACSILRTEDRTAFFLSFSSRDWENRMGYYQKDVHTTTSIRKQAHFLHINRTSHLRMREIYIKNFLVEKKNIDHFLAAAAKLSAFDTIDQHNRFFCPLLAVGMEMKKRNDLLPSAWQIICIQMEGRKPLKPAPT